MNREISVPNTNIYRILALVVSCLLLPLLVIFAVYKAHLGAIGPAFSFGAFAIFLTITANQWCRIEISDSGLFASRLFFFTQKSVFIPYGQIEEVSQHFYHRGRPETVTIKLKVDTELGRTIRFIAPGWRSSFLTEHQIVDELKSLIKAFKLDH